MQRDLNIIFWFLSSVNFLRTLNYSQSFPEQVVIFSNVIITVREKNAESICILIYFNNFLPIIYLIWCIWFTWCKSFTLPPSYVLTLCFEWKAPASRRQLLPSRMYIPEISRFEMILAWMSDICKFFKSITLFKNLMWKFWLLVTKLDACISLGYHVIPSSRSRSSNKSTYYFDTSKISARNGFENQ